VTCIVGLVHDGKVHIGGDSAASEGALLVVRKDPKVFTVGSYLIGCTSSFRMLQLLAHAFTPPEWDRRRDLYAFLVTDFIDAVRDCFRAGGFMRRDSEVEAGGVFLVGVAGRLFEIEEDYQVGETLNGFAAIGCGREVALGSLYSTDGKAPEARVLLALQAAEAFGTAVRGPFNMQVI